jgi:hypothetical protein
MGNVNDESDGYKRYSFDDATNEGNLRKVFSDSMNEGRNEEGNGK